MVHNAGLGLISLISFSGLQIYSFACYCKEDTNIVSIISAATITPSTKDVIAVEDHVISCVLGDIPESITGVTWAPATETSGEYNLVDGSENSNSQTSTLTITAAKLLSLDGQSSGVHTFTCSFTIGTTNVAVTATQTITIFSPSKNLQIRYCSPIYCSC